MYSAEAALELSGKKVAVIGAGPIGNLVAQTAKAKGADIIIVAVIPGDVQVNLGIVQDRELKLVGTLMYKEEDYIEAIKLLSSGKIDTTSLTTNYFDFKDYDAAYQLIEVNRDKAMKVMIKVTPD